MIIKRIIDIILSLIAIICLFPFMLIVAVLIYIKLGWPVLFVQERPGRKGKVFKIIKFRTMLDLKDESGQQLPDADRLTSFGKILRSTSIDEIPELFNVFKGDMSLVGPRPLLVEYMPLYSRRQRQRHSVRPGITGWAQINGRNLISWTEKFELDIWYIENWSLLLDIKIIIKTITKVISREGVNFNENISSEKFNGYN